MRRLLIRPGAIGDCILSLPALEFLRADETEVWVPSAVVPLIRFADRAAAISSTGLDLLEIPGSDSQALIDRLRQFDSICSWYGSNRPEFRDRVRELRLPFQFFTALPTQWIGVHAADFFLAEVGGKPPAVPRVELPAIAPGEFVVIHPFSGSPRKNWPLERFQELAGLLRVPVRWCIGPEDPPIPGAFRCDNLYNVACWLRGARAFIGNDSGIGHLAAAVGVPVLTIFGPMDPETWKPRATQAAIVSGNLHEITAEEVAVAARSLGF